MTTFRRHAKPPSDSAPRPDGPLARALSQAHARRALLRESGAAASAAEATRAADDRDALAREMAALAREAEARDPERLVTASLQREAEARRSRGQGGARRRMRWPALAIVVGAAALAAIAVVWSSPREPGAQREAGGLTLDYRMSTPRPGERDLAED